MSDVEMVQSVAARRSTHRRWLGLALLCIGILLVVLAGGYYLYGWVATQRLDSLVYAPRGMPATSPIASAITLEGLSGYVLPSASPSGTGGLPDPASLRLYPGERMAFNTWAEPWATQPISPLEEGILQGFLPADQFVLGNVGTLPPATAIRIPSIEVDAKVQDLAIKDLGDSQQYETPKHVVGHIPQTANPGELGNVWLFGHLQSPIRGEGSVFRDLPLIPDLLRSGQRVYVVLESPAMSYLYEVYKTDILYQDDLRLYDTDQATVTLVTCVPVFTYDYRLLVTARLVGVKAAP